MATTTLGRGRRTIDRLREARGVGEPQQQQQQQPQQQLEVEQQIARVMNGYWDEKKRRRQKNNHIVITATTTTNLPAMTRGEDDQARNYAPCTEMCMGCHDCPLGAVELPALRAENFFF